MSTLAHEQKQEIGDTYSQSVTKQSRRPETSSEPHKSRKRECGPQPGQLPFTPSEIRVGPWPGHRGSSWTVPVSIILKVFDKENMLYSQPVIFFHSSKS